MSIPWCIKELKVSCRYGSGCNICNFLFQHDYLCTTISGTSTTNIEYMQLISFILVIAAFVQFVEMFLKKSSPALYKSLGVYLPLITTNCTVLYVTQANISEGYNLLQTVVNSIAVPLGFMLVLFIFSCIRERLDSAETPAAWKGNPVALVVAGLMALALSGLAGIA